MTEINTIFKDVIDHSKILDVVSHYLGDSTIKKQGKNYVCLCPFHNDNHPSMSLDPSRNIFHCWSCNEKGGVLEFVMKYRKLSKIDALKELASISNISLPDNLSKVQSVSKSSKYQEEINLLKDLSSFYQLMLATKFGEDAKKYLSTRKLDEDIIKHFEIGFAPIDSHKSIEALEKKYSIPVFEKAGVLSSSKTLEDRMFNRIIFPLKDEYGNIIAFSGRKIDKSDSAKYINYPDTVLFTKGDHLYNYSEAKNEVKKTNYIYLVEGYMDAIAYYRANIKAVVASMGTALSENQIRLIKKLNVEVRLSFDSDIPGQTNQLKIMNQLLSNKIKVNCVRPFIKHKDADEVFFDGGEKLLSELSSKLIDPFLFYLAFTLRGRKELDDSNEINTFINNSKPYFVRLDEISKVKNLEILSKITKINTEELKSLFLPKKKETPIPQENFIPYQYNRKNNFDPNAGLINRIDKTYNPNDIDLARYEIKSFSETEQFKKYNVQSWIYNNEVELITNCFYSIEAVEILNREKYVFNFSPFNDLFYLISYIYQTSLNNSFNSEMFEQLIDALNSNENNQENQFEGIELSDITFNKDIPVLNLEYLKNYINKFLIFASSNFSDFNSLNFSKSLDKVSKMKNKKIAVKS